MANFTINNAFVDIVSSSPDIRECKSYDIVLTLSNPVQVNVNYTSCSDGVPSVHDFQVTQAVASGMETTVRLNGFCSLSVPTLTFEREVPHTLNIVDKGLCENSSASPSSPDNPRSPDEPPSSEPEEPSMPSVDPSQSDSPSDDVPSNDPSNPDYEPYAAGGGGDIPDPSVVHYVTLLPDTLSGWVTYKDADGVLKEREVLQKNPDDLTMPMMMICAKEIVEQDGVSIERTEENCP